MMAPSSGYSLSAAGLSGIGSNAGGLRYLHRLGIKRALSINTTAAGNTTLPSLQEEGEAVTS